MTPPHDMRHLSDESAKPDAQPPDVQSSDSPVGVELYRYAAFISYASEDTKAAQKLQRELERYKIPKSLGTHNIAGKVNRIAPVFRDRDELAAGRLGNILGISLGRVLDRDRQR